MRAVLEKELDQSSGLAVADSALNNDHYDLAISIDPLFKREEAVKPYRVKEDSHR